MRGLTAGKEVLLNGNLSWLLSSHLSRHISSLAELKGNLRCTPEQLRQVKSAMPFLRQLDFEPLQSSDWQSALPSLHLPSTLHTVLLYSLSNLSAENTNALIVMLSRHAALTELDLSFNQQPEPVISFAPLQAATSLTKLNIGAPAYRPLEQQHLQQIRQLAVTELDLCPCYPQTLQSLLQMDGPPLRWTKLPIVLDFIDDQVAALLPTLHLLSQLSLSTFCGLSSFAFLSQLPALRSLTMDLSGGYVTAADRYDDRLVAMNQPLSHLTSLKLVDSRLNTAQLAALLSLMPRLQSLWLGSMPNVDALTFLLPVKDTLRSLELAKCKHGDLVSAELLHLRQLQQLTELTLHRSLSEPLDTLSRALCTPPSLLLPQLKRFSYTPY